MKRGMGVYFISKGVVRYGIIESQDVNSVKVLYTKGTYNKRYTFKKNEVALEIERGTNGSDRLAIGSKSNNNEGVARRNKQDSELYICGVSNERRAGESKKVFKGAWQIRNMA